MSLFTENLIVSPLPDGETWVTRREFFYDVGEEGSGDRITVPIGFVTDFASVPRIFWKIIPKWGKYGNAAVIHDYLYSSHERSKKESDKIFYEGMLVLNTPLWKALIMYYAVKWFGWFSYHFRSPKPQLEISQEILEIPKINLKSGFEEF